MCPTWPLAGMGLTELHFNDTSVSDLSPLKGMPLTILSCANTRGVRFIRVERNEAHDVLLQ